PPPRSMSAWTDASAFASLPWIATQRPFLRITSRWLRRFPVSFPSPAPLDLSRHPSPSPPSPAPESVFPDTRGRASDKLFNPRPAHLPGDDIEPVPQVD